MQTYLYLHRENTAGPQDRYLRKYPLKHVDYELSRAVGRKGEIISDVRGGRIRIVVDGFAIQPPHMHGYSPSCGRLYGDASHYIMGEQQIEDTSPEAVKLSLRGLFANGEAVITIKSGMTLSHLAVLFDVTVGELVTWNNIENPNKIYVGQRIKIFKDNIPTGIRPTQGEIKELSEDITCEKCLDLSTVGKNYFRSSYIGPNNPMSRDEKWSYIPVPTMRAEYPAIGHDRRYDNLEIEGANGLLTDTRAIGADWQFVAEEFIIYHTTPVWSDPKSKIVAGVSAIGLGLAATPKTYYQLYVKRAGFINPIGLYRNIKEIIDGYKMSNVNKDNQRVTNKPYEHKH